MGSPAPGAFQNLSVAAIYACQAPAMLATGSPVCLSAAEPSDMMPTALVFNGSATTGFKK